MKSDLHYPCELRLHQTVDRRWVHRRRPGASQRTRVWARRCAAPTAFCRKFLSCGVGRGVSPRPQPQTGRASFQASGFPDSLGCGIVPALGHMTRQSIALSMLPVLLGLRPQSSLDHFHVHREPSRLVNPSVVQNDKSCRPSPCGWLSQPRTTTTAPSLVCFVGGT